MARKFSRARVEAEILRSEIEQRLSKGQSLRRIFADLSAEGLTSVKERQFYNAAGEIREAWLRDRLTSANSASNVASNDSDSVDRKEDTAVSAAVVPLARKSGAGGFTLNRDFNIEE